MNPTLTLPNFARHKSIPPISSTLPIYSIPPINKSMIKQCPVLSPTHDPLLLPISPLRSPVIAISPLRSPVIAISPLRSPVISISPLRSPVIAISPILATSPLRSGLRSPVRSPVRSPIIARSPLYVPKIGMIKDNGGSKIVEDSESKSYKMKKTVLQPGENPWLQKRVEGCNEIKIMAITPIGKISMVPTSDRRPEQTPRRVPMSPTRALKLRVIGEKNIDPMMNVSIYLDCGKEDREYNYVAERMKKITNNTITQQKKYATELRDIISISGRVKENKFEEALSIYENNQVYYQDRLDDKMMELSKIKTELTNLEYWFGQIIEPIIEGEEEICKEHELVKITKGRTAYCDPELYEYIEPFTEKNKINIERIQRIR